MLRKILAFLLAAAMMLSLWGCTEKMPAEQTEPTEETVQTLPPATVPADGNPDDVTCKGSYTSADNPDSVVAVAGEMQLTNEQLWCWYWAEVAQYRQTQQEPAPDFEEPLDVQECPADDSVGSWQQYFLKKALQRWHSAQALQLQAYTEPIPTEEAYQPNAATHERSMTGMPAAKFLYGYDKTYETNTMHQSYLDALPELLEQLSQEKGYSDAEALAQAAAGVQAQSLAAFAQLYNYSYMYLTFLSYDLEPDQALLEAWFADRVADYEAQGITRDSRSCVDIRHILLLPEDMASEESWETCVEQAQTMLNKWQKAYKSNETTFAELAYRNSQDTAMARQGGAYRNLQQGQLIPALDQWCFAPERQPGDSTVLRTEEGVHILYFSGSSPLWQESARLDWIADQQSQWLEAARERYPMEVDYSAITLPQAAGILSYEDILYPDVAHERYPEVPLYLQQDYPYTWYGNYKISSHGCGITTFSMLSTYMSDEEWTPPEMCDLYGVYSFENGTDGMIFFNESPNFNYFCKEKTYDPNVAKAALEDGYIVISIQHKGYWTSGGHYILFEKLTEDGMVQVRDSNIANYVKLKQHKEDKHTWFNSTYAGSGYWIIEKKNTTVPVCARCGDPESMTQTILADAYRCDKCERALLRRNNWLMN